MHFFIQAAHYIEKSLKTHELVKDSDMPAIASCHLNLGTICLNTNKLETSLEHNLKGLNVSMHPSIHPSLNASSRPSIYMSIYGFICGHVCMQVM